MIWAQKLPVPSSFKLWLNMTDLTFFIKNTREQIRDFLLYKILCGKFAHIGKNLPCS